MRREDGLNLRDKVIGCVFSKSKLHRAEKREECAARVDIFEPVAGLQRGRAACENDVFAQRRAVRHADAEVFADAVANGGFEQYDIRAARCVRSADS